ncbi:MULTISPECIES: tryptophan synthase subunit alpha [Nitrincola]|uniref:Uncharacterized protein n=1 Tax=Nitrincola nitratireducens TaxID=1229521 RepID=W9V1D8_9GAMM|nr:MULTISPECIES: tryptophan synthase subunit alpha [Nitrincola]EXJ09942.1 hypothetical protein D791_03095 [Nitrincola nitratireducens]
MFQLFCADSVGTIENVSDGVVVGSVLVSQIASLVDSPELIPSRVSAIIADMRTAMDA